MKKLLLLCPLILFAQDEKPKPVEEKVEVIEELPQVPVVETSLGSKLDLRVTKVPMSVSTIGREHNQTQNNVILGEALRQVSGINVQTESGATEYFLIRGFDSNSSGMVMTDGALEPESSFINLYNVEKIEVMKGPSAFLFGGRPLAGAVNLARKKPMDKVAHRVQIGAGSFESRQAQMDLNFGREGAPFSFRFNGFYDESDGFRDLKANETSAFNPTLAFQPSERLRIDLSLEWMENEYISDAGIPLIDNRLPDVPRETDFQSPYDLSEQSAFRGQVDLNYQISENWQLHNKFYNNQLDWNSKGTIFNGTFPSNFAGHILARSLILLEDDQNFTGNQLEFKWSQQTGSIQHQILLGYEYRKEKDDFYLNVAYLPFTLVGAPDLNVLPPVNEDGLEFIPGQLLTGQAETEISAPYIAGHTNFGFNCHMMYGVRFDAISYKDRVVPGVSSSYDKTSPMFGFAWEPAENSQLYGNFGKSYSPQSTLTFGTLEPEESRQYEIGYKHSWNENRALFTAAVFDLERENMAIVDNTGIRSQTGTQLSQGVEVDFEAMLNESLRLRTNVTFTDAELVEFREYDFFVIDNVPEFVLRDYSGNMPAFVPEWMANIWLEKQWSSFWNIGIGARYLGEQFIYQDNNFSIPSSTVVDGQVAYLSKWGTFRLNLKNLTDEDYEIRGYSKYSVIPAEPFHAEFNWALNF